MRTQTNIHLLSSQAGIGIAPATELNNRPQFAIQAFIVVKASAAHASMVPPPSMQSRKSSEASMRHCSSQGGAWLQLSIRQASRSV